MILDRIIKSFWGRYVFYLSVFVAVYFLMRNAIDNALYGLGALLFGQLEGCHSAIAWIVLAFLVADPIYRKCTQKASVVNQPLFAFVLVPVSAWYSFQVLVPHIEKHIIFDLLYIFILLATLAYSSIIAFERSRRLRLSKKGISFLLKDEPINGDSNDELGFTIYADSISSNIKDVVGNKRSFVFGIEGSWGSGKTSFINMVKARLKNHKEIRIVDFNPWMSSSSKQISSDFFKRMTEEVSDLHLKAKFREYGKLLAAVDKTGIVEKVVDRISTSQDLGTMLESINYCIERQNLRFVVFIDDTDRLDKEELLAVFKLVRNTASFSNTVFVLTYDRDYVETVLEKYFDDKHTAKAYSDKIVNFQFELPNSAKDHYEILKEKINKSEFIKAHPDIRLNNDDLPKEITTLLDSYRKVKRVFNALAVESDLPHFEKIPVKFTLVFFYMAYYQKGDYEMVKEAYINYNNNKIVYDFIDKGVAELSPLGKKLLRIIEHSNQVGKPKTQESKALVTATVTEKEKEKTEEEERKYKRFKEAHSCIYTLLDDKNNGVFIKYLEYLFKFNAIHYKEYKEKYTTYGIDGYKNINLELSDAEKILKRIIEIQENFPKTFYDGSVNELLGMFSHGEKKDIAGKDLKLYYEFIFGLLLNSSATHNNSSLLISKINEHYAEYDWNGVEILNILNWIDDISNTSKHPLVEYSSNFSNNKRYDLSSVIYKEILDNIIRPRLSLPYKKEDVQAEANKHLQKAIDNELDYDTIEFALIACLDDIKNNFRYLGKKACSTFRSYIEKNPDVFVEKCFQIAKGNFITEYVIEYHPYLMQIFEDNQSEAIGYFNSVSCKSERSNLALKMIRKYLPAHLKVYDPERPLLKFEIEREDFELMFDHTDKDKSASEAQQRPLIIADTSLN